MAHQSFPAVEFNLYDPEAGRTEALPLCLRPAGFAAQGLHRHLRTVWVAVPGQDGERPFLAHGIYRQTAGGIQ